MLRWLTVLAFQCMLTAASPLAVPIHKTHSLSRRECNYKANSNSDFDCDLSLPTIPQIIAHMRDSAHGGYADDKHSAAFFTNLAYPKTKSDGTQIVWIHRWLETQGMKDKTFWLQHNIDHTWYRAQYDHILSHPTEFIEKYGTKPLTPLDTYQNCVYQALSAAALHPDAYLFIPKGVNPRPESVWTKIEFPHLIQNEHVKRIYRIDPRSAKDRGQQGGDCGEADKPELIWDRDRGDKTVAPFWSCPVSGGEDWETEEEEDPGGGDDGRGS